MVTEETLAAAVKQFVKYREIQPIAVSAMESQLKALDKWTGDSNPRAPKISKVKLERVKDNRNRLMSESFMYFANANRAWEQIAVTYLKGPAAEAMVKFTELACRRLLEAFESVWAYSVEVANTTDFSIGPSPYEEARVEELRESLGESPVYHVLRP